MSASLLRGAAAGVAGTAAYTVLSSRLRKRESVRSVNAVLHWGYGAWGGVARTFIDRRLGGWRAEAAHLAVVWLPWRLVLAAKPGPRPDSRAVAIDFGKHATYVLVTGLAYRTLSGQDAR